MSGKETVKRRLRGTVVSDKMDQSVVVQVKRMVKFPLYEKFVRRFTKLMAHNPDNEARVGDMVEIEECRPLSKRKSWKLVQIIQRAV